MKTKPWAKAPPCRCGGTKIAEHTETTNGIPSVMVLCRSCPVGIVRSGERASVARRAARDAWTRWAAGEHVGAAGRA